MADINRTADAAWQGDIRGGKGNISTGSGALKNTSYSFSTRFEQEPGTNPEELIAAAHAACYTMNLSGTLGRKGYKPQNLETHATCTVAPKQGGGFQITRIQLVTHAKVDGIDDDTFQQIAKEAEQTCPVSNALRSVPEISLNAKLES